jgi:predicted metallo-beta-lactamase superfamily hydrolase
MKIIPLAAESLGVRSSAFFVETSDLKILIDPGVSLAPVRFGLPPHPLEVKAMNESWGRIKEYAARADVFVITHYHFDHYDPTEPLVFNGKTLLVKHPKETINGSQRDRAKNLIKNFRMLPRRVEFADGNTFEFGKTAIRFSLAVPHGPSTKVGWVVEVSIREGKECFLHSSDIQGACRPEHMEFIRAESPDTMYLDGPLTYMMGQEFTPEDLRASVNNISSLIETSPLKTAIIDHHLLREEKWKEKIGDVFSKAKKHGKKVVTSAGFMDQEDEILEAHRRQLFAWHPEMLEVPIRRNKNFQLVKELNK